MSQAMLEPAALGSERSGLTMRRPVAVLLSRFPLITETFILREIIEMERQGQSVVLVPLIEESPPVIHREALPWMKRALFTPFVSRAILASNLRLLLRRPRRYLGAVWTLWAGTLSSGAFFVRSFALFPKAVHLAECLENRGVEHVHAHFATHPATVALVISRLTRIGFSITVHAHDIFVDRVLLARKLSEARFIRTISRFNRDFLAARYPQAVEGKIEVVHVGVQPPSVEPMSSTGRRAGMDPSRRRILCVAALKPYKGLPVLLRALRRLADGGAALACDVVGEGSERGRLEELVERLDLQDVVTFVGAKRQQEVGRMMAEAAFLVLPSVVATDGQMEGIPVVLMEAMAARKAVVAASLSGIPELVRDGENGLLVEPGNVEALAVAMGRLLQDPALCRRMGRAGRTTVHREFDLTQSMRSLGALIDRHNPPPAPWVQRAVTALIGPEARVGLRAIHEGRDSSVAELGLALESGVSELVIKRPRSRDGESRSAKAMLLHEHDVLERLRRELDGELSVPRALAMDVEEGCLLMEACEGVPLAQMIRSVRSSSSADGWNQLERALFHSGRWLRRFQQATPEDLGAPVVVDRIAQDATRSLEVCRGALSRRQIGTLRSTVEAVALRLARTPLSVVGHHGDLWPGNVFVDGGRITVIDFEGFRPGLVDEDVAYFLSQLAMFLPAGDRRLAGLVEAFWSGFEPDVSMAQPRPTMDLCRIAKLARILELSLGTPGAPAWVRRRRLRSMLLRAGALS